MENKIEQIIERLDVLTGVKPIKGMTPRLALTFISKVEIYKEYYENNGIDDFKMCKDNVIDVIKGLDEQIIDKYLETSLEELEVLDSAYQSKCVNQIILKGDLNQLPELEGDFKDFRILENIVMTYDIVNSIIKKYNQKEGS